MRRNKHNLSHYKLFSCDMGELIPCGLMEVLPGDSIQHATSCLVRAAPLLSPVMHPVHVRIHHWFVPHRLVWDNWENFITGGPDGLNASVFPTIAMPGAGGAPVGSLADYYGVPTGVNSLAVSALPFRGHALIYNSWYRDQDLTTPIAMATTDGVDAITSTALQVCCWEKDYFTSARPWELKGPSITIPLGTAAPVVRKANAPAWDVLIAGGNTRVGNAQTMNTTAGGLLSSTGTGAPGVSLDPGASGLEANLSAASAVTVNVLRQALALQRFQEARARYGSRYVEYLRFLGVRSSDGRLDLPEYLGGGKQTIQFSEVLQTAEGTNGVGTMRGHGISSVRSNRYRRFFEEHGYVHSFISVRPKTMYINGLHRTWNRRTKEDFWQKEIETIGQQAIKNKELYGAHATPDGTFGYQDRYDDYRRMESSVGGEFRSTLLNFWHMARDFGAAPALNSSFVQCIPTERTFAVPAQDVIYVMAKHNVVARRLVAQTGKSFTF